MNATKSKRHWVSAVLIAAMAALAGCSTSGSGEVFVEPVPPAVATGTMTVTWTVLGAASPDACDAVGALDLELLVYDMSGLQAADVHADCADFALTVELPEGTYSADVTLVDPYDNAVSTTLTLDNIDIIAGTDITSDIDFPDSSIL